MENDVVPLMLRYKLDQMLVNAVNMLCGLTLLLGHPNRTSPEPYLVARELMSFTNPYIYGLRVVGLVLMLISFFLFIGMIFNKPKFRFGPIVILAFHWMWWAFVFGFYAVVGGGLWGIIFVGALATVHLMMLLRLKEYK